MQTRSKSTLLSLIKQFWYLFLPFFVLGLEWGLQKEQQFLYYHYSVAFRDQPVASTWHLLHVLFRTFCTLLSFFAVVALLWKGLSVWIPRYLDRTSLKVTSALALYALCLRFVFIEKPAVSSFYSLYYPKLLFLCVSSSFVLLVLYSFVKRSHAVTGRARGAVVSLTLALLGLLVSVPTYKTDPKPISKKEANLPSFFLLGIDGIPGDIFHEGTSASAFAPEWKKNWQDRATQYQNAYAVTNSTYTSWFSIFSGSYPLKTGVETLYPVERNGVFPKESLLPHLLKEKGYQTVFMTDCGATSYMETDMGFETRVQHGAGILECGRSFLTSRHPLAHFLNATVGKVSLFPELNNFCSALYRPDVFFKEVEAKLKELNQSNAPYFLAVHSCLTHQLIPHSPPMHSSLRDNLNTKPSHSPKKHNLALSLRQADYYLDRVLKTQDTFGQKPWTFLFSDHGVRIEKQREKLKYFTHAVGFPVNRFQYNVPLNILSPEPSSSKPQQLVGLIDLYPSILSLAKIEPPENDGLSLWEPPQKNRSLLLTSSMPIHLDPDNPELINAFWKNTLDEKGFHHFPLELEEELLERRAVALLKLPYRYVFNPREKDTLHHELEDPYAAYDLLQEQPDVAKHYRDELCSQYEHRACRALPKALSQATINR